MADRDLVAYDDGGLAFTEVDTDLYKGKVAGANVAALTTIAATDYILVVQAGGTVKKVLPANILSGLCMRGRSFTNADLVDGVLSYAHNTGIAYGMCQVTNGSGNVVVPDNVNTSNANTALVNLVSWGTISLTWHVGYVAVKIT